MQDNKGNKVSFKNSVIIFTTNLGCNKDTGKAIGMGLVKTKENENNSAIRKAIDNYFSPEFLGRLDDIVFFNKLTNEIARDLIDRYFNEYKERANFDLKLSDDNYNAIIKDADIETKGARGLRKSVKKEIVNMIITNKELNAALDF